VIVAAIGLGGLTPVPATGWLVGLAAIALLGGRGTTAGAWAVTATFGPLVALAGDGGLSAGAQATVHDAVGTGLAPAVVGVGAAAVLTVLAHRRKALPLAALAGVALVGGGAVAWQDLDPGASAALVAAAAAFVLVETAALLVRRDAFWSTPAHRVGIVTEALAIPSLVGLASTLALAPVVLDGPEVSTAVAAGLAAIAWLVADLRRGDGADQAPGLGLLVGSDFWLGTVAATVNVIAVVSFGTGSDVAAGVATLGVAALLVLSGRAGSAGLVPVLALVAPLLVSDEPVLVGVVGVTAGLLLAYQATLHRAGTSEGIATVAPAPLLVAGLLLSAEIRLAPLLLGGLAVLWAEAALLDRARSGDRLGDVPRLFGVAVVLSGLAGGLPVGELAAVAAAFTALATVDTFRRRDARLAWAWAFGVPVTIATTASALGLPEAQLGLPLTIAAIPFAVVTLRLGRLRPAVSATAVALATSGIAFATLDPGVMGTVLILDGVALLAAGLLIDHPALAVTGGLAAVVGTWQHLTLGGVESIDLYALPVAALLWLVGSQLADDDAPSWVTHAPAIALAGGTALAERIGGGGGGHALLTGVIGVLAVVEGGGRRLAAPLVLGTGLLVALTAHETTAVTAGVPTWAWLAAGGTLLVGAGLTMERHELGPVETGRRLVDVVQDRFR
jgi:hypothetical protein